MLHFERIIIKFSIAPSLILFFHTAFCSIDSSMSTNNINNSINKVDNNLPIVSTDLGKIVGKNLLSRNRRHVLGFLGVPYAEPPIGDRRFKVSKEPKPWKGILNGKKFRDQCSQTFRTFPHYFPLGPVGSEDCLYLNIYTSKKIEELRRGRVLNLFPVIVFIHGGYKSGNGSIYGYDYFLDEDVVFITLDFRLQVYANLNTKDGVTSGNLGLKDQVLALKWIRKHINKFGGDPKKVTIFGESAGSMEVSAHLISPMSKGLFQRAIMQSGTILCPEIFTPYPKKVAFELGAKVGCGINSTTFELVSCLRKIDEKTLTLASTSMDFDFSIEAKSSSPLEKNFLAERPVSLLKDGKINKVPVLQGVLSAEGIVSSLRVLKDIRDGKLEINQKEDWDLFFRKYLLLNHVRNSSYVFDKIRKYYFNNSEKLSLNNFDSLTNLFSDRMFIHPLNFYVYNEYRDFKHTTPIFLYFFTKSPRKSQYEETLRDLGIKRTDIAGHADDLNYFFNLYHSKKIVKGSKYYEFSKKLIRIYVNFAKYGDPNGEIANLKLTSTKNVWRAFNGENKKNWYEIGDKFQMINPVESRMKFWDSFDPYELYY